MPNPVTSVRVTPENRDILKQVVALLNAGYADHLRRLLADADWVPLGPYQTAEAATSDAVHRLIAQLDPNEIWLFGSRARGDHRPDSDIDLLGVLPDGLPSDSYTLRAACKPLLGGGAPVDVFPLARRDFETDPEALGGLAAVARAEGRRLYRARRLDQGAAA
jgi:uncharacterized protein